MTAQIRTAARRLLSAPVLLGYVVGELVRANAIVAWKVVGPQRKMRAAIIACPIRSRTDHEIAVLTSLLSLMPGTLPIEVDRDGGRIYIHALHAPSTAALHQEVRRLENRLLAVLR